LSKGEKAERLVRISPTIPQIKLCPVCLKPLKQLSQLSSWLTPDYYYCEACGYSGSVALEPVKDESNE